MPIGWCYHPALFVRAALNPDWHTCNGTRCLVGFQFETEAAANGLLKTLRATAVQGGNSLSLKACHGPHSVKNSWGNSLPFSGSCAQTKLVKYQSDGSVVARKCQ